jgi:hypothetical protein
MRAPSRIAVTAALILIAAVGAAFASDEPDEFTVLGKSAVLKTGKFVKCLVRPSVPAGTLDLPNVPDNDPTIEGGSIKFYERANPTNQNTFLLPATGWKTRGDPLAPTAFRYHGLGLPGDPCGKVVVNAHRVSAKCKGTDVTLAPPFADPRLGVILTIGTDSKRYCPVFGAGKNEPGFFRGGPTLNAAPCSPSGAFLD